MAWQSLRATIVLGVAALMVASSATLAFAPHVVRVEIEPGTASPGEEISVFGPVGYGGENPVEVHWNEPDGELLGTFETGEGFYAEFGPEEVTIPEDAESGQNLIVVTQELEDSERHIRGLPAYAPVQVVGGAEPTDEGSGESAASASDVERTSTLTEADPPGLGLLVGVGVAALAIALAVAALVAKALGRGGSSSAPETTRA